MKTISVPDMMCEHCVARITEALQAKDLKFTVDLAGKTVSIDGCEHWAATAIREPAQPGQGTKAEGKAPGGIAAGGLPSCR